MHDSRVRVHLLDLGTERYGDSILIESAGRSVLVDGGHWGDSDDTPQHPSLQAQIRDILESDNGPIPIDLLVVSHAHDDHIGCLPTLVKEQFIAPKWAYLPNPELAWPDGWDEQQRTEGPERAVLAALREESLVGLPDAQLQQALVNAANLRVRYDTLLDHLPADCQVVYHGDSPDRLHAEFRDLGLRLVGPNLQQIELAHSAMSSRAREDIRRVEAALGPALLKWDAADLYRAVAGETHADALSVAGPEVRNPSRTGAAVNLQSAVLTLNSPFGPLFFAGDMEFEHGLRGDAADGDDLKRLVRDLWHQVVALAPYGFVKLSHHGSRNSNPDGFPASMGCRTFGICTGIGGHQHPSVAVLQDLVDADASWVRTDTNGRCTITIGTTGVELHPSRGALNDASAS